MAKPWANKKRLAAFNAQLEAAEKVHKKYVQRWQQMRDVYHGANIPARSREDSSERRLFIPWVFQQIETLSPRLIDPEPTFSFNVVNPEKHADKTMLNSLIRSQLAANQWVSKQKPIIDDALVCGLGIVKIVWHKEYRKMKIRKNPTPLDVILKRPSVIEEKICTANRPELIHCALEDTLWDPAATNDDEWEYVFHRSWLTMSELKQREKKGIYSNVSKVDAIIADEAADGVRSPTESEEEAIAKRRDRVEVIERWHIDGTKMVVANRQVILQDGESGFYHGEIPFKALRIQPTPDSLVGISEVEKLEQIQNVIWTMENQRRDAVNQALNQIMVLDPTIKGAANLTLRNGGKILATHGQRIEQLRVDPSTAPAWDEQEAYLGAMQQISGASPMLAGADSSSFGINNDTATGASIMQEEANKRIALKKLQVRIFQAKIAKMMVQLSQQYLMPKDVVEIIGSDGAVWNPQPEEIPAFLDVIPQGMNESTAKQVERSSAVEMMNTLAQFAGMPMPDGTQVNLKAAIERFVQTFDVQPEAMFTQAQPMQPGPMGGPAGPEDVEGSVMAVPGEDVSAINETLM